MFPPLSKHTPHTQHTTEDEPLPAATLPPAALPSLSMAKSAMDPNRGAVDPCAPNGGARRLGLRALRLMPLFGALKWRPSKN